MTSLKECRDGTGCLIFAGTKRRLQTSLS